MTRATAAVLAAIALVLIAGCTGSPILEDRSGEVWLKHRQPGK